MSDEWKKVESSKAHDFKTTPELVGVFLSKQASPFGGDDYTLQVGEEQVLVFGKTALKSKLGGLKPGTKVKIVYLGEKVSPKSKRTYADFDVFTQ